MKALVELEVENCHLAKWYNHFNGSKSSQSIDFAEFGLIDLIVEVVFAVLAAGVKGAAETFQDGLDVGGAAGARKMS